MRCPKCLQQDTKVIDSRNLQEGDNVRRRRKCEACEFRFTTYEKTEVSLPAVLKRDGRTEDFNRHKIFSGLSKACQKRPITSSDIEKIIDDLESFMTQSGLKDFPSENIGHFLMETLNKKDQAAYVRFASFYWNYDTVQSFINDLSKKTSELNNNKENNVQIN